MSASQTNLNPSRTRFRFELEFFILYPENMFDGSEWDGDEYAMLSQIHHSFLSAYMGATSVHQVHQHGYPAGYNTWVVADNDHALLEQEQDLIPQGYTHQNCKLSSPWFEFRDEHTWLTNITHMWTVLEPYTRHGDIRMVTNIECGLNVHIANDSRPIPLRAAKNLLQIVTGFERCFDILHARSRISHNHHDCAPPSKFLLTRSSNPDTWRRIIENEVTSLESLRSLFVMEDAAAEDGETNGSNSAYNFDNLQSTDPRSNNTIEFRQHCGTISMQATAMWIKLCAALVHASARITQTELQSLLDQKYNLEFDTFDLFDALNVPSEISDYYRDRIRIRRNANGEWFNGWTAQRRRDFHATPDFRHPNPWRDFWIQLMETDFEELDSMGVKQEMVNKYNHGHYGRWPNFQSWRGPDLPGGPAQTNGYHW